MKKAHLIVRVAIVVLLIICTIKIAELYGEYEKLDKACFQENSQPACDVLANQTWIQFTDPNTGLIITPQAITP